MLASAQKQPIHFLPKDLYLILCPTSCICVQFFYWIVGLHIYFWTFFRSHLHFVQITSNSSSHFTHLCAVNEVITTAISLCKDLSQTSRPLVNLSAKFSSDLPFRQSKAPPAGLLLNWRQTKTNTCQTKEIQKCNNNITGIPVSFSIWCWDKQSKGKKLILQRA